MRTTRLAAALRVLRRAAKDGGAGVADAELLARYARRRDEAAFELLLYRHGPMVLAACRRVLHHAADAEDAFQATFLTLVRRARSIRRGESLAGWLYRVARRIALRLRAVTPPAGTAAAEPATPGPDSAADWRDLGVVLDEEIGRLPAKYRAAVVLCYLGGRTHAEAAHELGCPRGTVAVRLLRARQLLQKRLTRRGVTPAVGVLTAGLAGELRAAPVELVGRTLVAAARFQTGAAASGVVPGRAVELAAGALREMTMRKVKAATAALALTCGVLASAAGVLTGPAPATERAGGRAEERGKPPAAPADDRGPLVDVVSERDGRLMAVGTEVRITDKELEQLPPEEKALYLKATYAYLVVEAGPDERVPADQRLSFAGDSKVYRRWRTGEPLPPGKVRAVGEPKTYKILQIGDWVRAGEVVALVNPAIAIDDLNVKVTMLAAAEADRKAAVETKLEAERRYHRDEALFARGTNAVSRDEMEQSRLTWSRYVQEEAAKTAAVAKAQVEINSALTVLGQYEVRVASSGVVRAIRKRQGEGVKSLDPILQMEIREPDAGPAVREVRSPCRGTVRAVRKRPGDAVEPGEVLVEVAPDRPQ
jgi:RNA polymerase sigma factor (sigma-70 family)